MIFFFGLIHGFGFAGVLAELNLPTPEFVRALFEFNVGLLWLSERSANVSILPM